MKFFPRLRQACRGNHREPVDAPRAAEIRRWQGPSANADTRRGHPSFPGAAGAQNGRDQDSRLAMNCVYLSGVLAADPQADRGRDGNPVVLLLLAFPAPDTPNTVEGVETASCEVEVPAAVARRCAVKLRAGQPILLTGQLTGGGGVMATEVLTGVSGAP